MDIVNTYNLNKTKVFPTEKKCPLGIQEFLKDTNHKYSF